MERPKKDESTIQDEELDYTDPRVCQHLKTLHDECFYRWYHDEFLTGKAKEQPCQELWEPYQACVHRRLKALDLDPKSLTIDRSKNH